MTSSWAALVESIDRLTAAVDRLAAPAAPLPPEPALCQRCLGKGQFAHGVPCAECGGSGVMP